MPCKPCCCIASRNGAIAIGILQIVFCGMNIVKIVQAIDAISDLESLPDNSKRKTTGIQKLGRKYPSFEDSQPSTFFILLYILLSFWLLMMVINIVFGSLLIYGILKKCSPLIQTHLIFTFLYIILLFLSQLLNLSPSLGFTVESDKEVLYYFSLYLVRFYLIYVVYCAYLETQESQMPRTFAAEMYACPPQPLTAQPGAFYYYPSQTCQQVMAGQAQVYYPPQQLAGQGQGHQMQYAQNQSQGPLYPQVQTHAEQGQSYQYANPLQPYAPQSSGQMRSQYPYASNGQAVQYTPYAI